MGIFTGMISGGEIMKKEYIYAAVSIVLWSTVAVTTKLLLGSLNSFQVLWASTFFAGLALLISNILSGAIKQLKNYKPKDFLISVLIHLLHHPPI